MEQNIESLPGFAFRSDLMTCGITTSKNVQECVEVNGPWLRVAWLVNSSSTASSASSNSLRVRRRQGQQRRQRTSLTASPAASARLRQQSRATAVERSGGAAAGSPRRALQCAKARLRHT
eukprot:6187971-Pleurochrysis_carterae.AAC.3